MVLPGKKALRKEVLLDVKSTLNEQESASPCHVPGHTKTWHLAKALLPASVLRAPDRQVNRHSPVGEAQTLGERGGLWEQKPSPGSSRAKITC